MNSFIYVIDLGLDLFVKKGTFVAIWITLDLDLDLGLDLDVCTEATMWMG